MKRKLFPSPTFVRSVKRLTRRDPKLENSIQATVAMLVANAFDAQLGTHKLKGDLKDSYACSARYDLRIVFRLLKRDSDQVIFLQDVGTHDDVY